MGRGQRRLKIIKLYYTIEEAVAPDSIGSTRNMEVPAGIGCRVINTSFLFVRFRV